MIFNIATIMAIGLLGLSSHSAQAATETDYAECFKEMQPNFVYPLAGMDTKCKAKGVFGPFVSACIKPGKYAFSRSASIDTVLANKAYAIADGKVVEATRNFLEHIGYLRTVILEHEFPSDKKCMFQGQEVKSFYTIYSQLFKGLRAIKFDIGQEVKAGEAVGAVSICGTCPEGGPNLIFQLRLNVDHCPDIGGDCVEFGSPVHTNLVRPAIEATQDYGMNRVDGTEDLTVAISTPCQETDIVEYHARCGTGGGGSMSVEKTHTVNLNTREGLDPIPDLYKQNKEKPYIDPLSNPFYPRQDGRWTTNFVVPPSWFPLTDENKCCYIEATDLWGKSVSKTYCGPAAP